MELAQTYCAILLRLPPKLFQYIFISKKKLNNNFKLFDLKFGRSTLKMPSKLLKHQKIFHLKKILDLSGLNLAFLGYYFKNDIQQRMIYITGPMVYLPNSF